MADFEYQLVNLPRTVSRGAAARLFNEQAEYGHWELARVRIYPDGTRKAWLRRKVIRVRRTA